MFEFKPYSHAIATNPEYQGMDIAVGYTACVYLLPQLRKMLLLLIRSQLILCVCLLQTIQTCKIVLLAIGKFYNGTE